MAKARKIKQILVKTENKVGMLAEVTSAISSQGTNILAICAYGMEGEARFMIVTNNNAKAINGLKSKGYSVKEEEVVEAKLGNKVGALAEISKKIADADIDLNYIYGSTADSAPATLVLSSNNNSKLVEILG